MAKCGDRNLRGKPCGAPALGGTKPPRCAAHAKGAEAARMAEIRREGGRQRARQVYRKAPKEAAPVPLENRTDALDAMRQVHAKIASGELSARDGSVMLTAIRDMLPMLPPGPMPPHPFFDSFKEIVIERDRTSPGGGSVLGVKEDGTEVLFTDVQRMELLGRDREAASRGQFTSIVVRRRSEVVT